MRYNPNPLLMTVVGNPGRPYQDNPHILIDSANNEVIGIERGHPIKTFERAADKAYRAARELGRNVHIVAHPGVPKWMKRGVQVSGLFLAMGPYVTMTPEGEWIKSVRGNAPRARRNPGFGASLAGSLAGGLIANAMANPSTRGARRFMSEKIRTLIHEGYPQRQAVAIAYSEARRLGYRVNPVSRSEVSSNPGPRGRRRITMTIDQFARWVKAKRDPAMWRAFLAKFRGYEKWTHGARSRKVTLEWQDVPGMTGLWITYDGGKQPESTYIMPKGSPRKGAWKHPWDTMPDIKHDPEAGVVLTKLRGKSRITDFYHK